MYIYIERERQTDRRTRKRDGKRLQMNPFCCPLLPGIGTEYTIRHRESREESYVYICIYI